MEKINPLDFESRYYMFDEINKAHFDGRLPRPEISIENFENRNVVGENLLAVFSPPGLRCNVPTIRLPNEPGFYADIWEMAVAMAHEMIHYSNYLKGVDDIEMRGSIQWHTKAFADEAKQHNLYDWDFNLAGFSCDEDAEDERAEPSPIFAPCGFSDCIACPDIDLSIYEI